MGIVCPTVTAYSTEEYDEQIGVVAKLTDYVHIDLGDGVFTKKMVDVREVWWPRNVTPNVHLMYERPSEVLGELIALKPRMVILHAEAKDDISQSIQTLRSQGIRAGIALLQGTSVKSVKRFIEQVDHVLIFSGSLGSFGGIVDYSLLKKVTEIRSLRPSIEIGWDGGINADNIRKLHDGGVDILNVGGAIQKANHPENVYRDLERRLHD